MLREAGEFDGQAFSFGDMSQPKAPTVVTVESGAHGAAATIADAHLLFNSDFARSGNDLHLNGHDGDRAIVRDYFSSAERPALMSSEGARLSPDLVEALTGGVAPAQYAQAAPAPPAAGDAVGRVVTASGDATILRNGAPVTLRPGDPVLRADVLQTTSGTMAVTFNDGSTLNLTANTRIVVSEFIYSPNGAGNSQLLDLVQGSLTFISGEVAHTGNMRIGTPVATMGIRGTVGGVTTASDGTVQFYVSQSATGAVIINAQGQVIANVVQDGPLIVVRPVGPLQVIADEIQKSPQQLAVELQALQQIVSIKAVGDQLLQQFLQPQQTPNPNPQSPQNGPHTQIQTDDKLKITLFTDDGQNGSGDTGGPASHAIIELVKNIPDDTPTSPVTAVLPSDLPPVTFAPLNVAAIEDVPVKFTGANAIFVADDSAVIHIKVSVPVGTLSAASMAGVTFAPGVGHATLEFTGSAAAVNAFLDGLTFTPPQDYNGSVVLSIVTSDGVSPPMTTTVSVDVAAVNDAPVLNYFNVNVPDGGTVVLTPNDFSVTDPDGPVTIFIVSNVTGGEFVVAQSGNSFSAHINADGPITFTAADIAAGRVSFVHDGQGTPGFTISVSDGEASSPPSVEVVVITDPVNDAPVVEDATAHVSEEGLLTGVHDTGGSCDVTDSATAQGTISATDADGDSLTYSLGTPETGCLKSGGVEIEWQLSEDGSLHGYAGETEVIAVSIDGQTGEYTVTLNGPIDHPNDSAEDTLNIDVPVHVFDGTVTTDATLTVKVEDDSPKAVSSQHLSTAAVTRDFNVAFVLDYSGSIDNTELHTMLGAVKTAAQALFEGTTGDVAITVVTFASSAVTLGPFTSYASFVAAINGTDPAEGGTRPPAIGSGTNFDAAVEQVRLHFTPAVGASNEVFFLSDGQSAVTSQATAWNNFVDGNHISVTAVGIGDGISNSGLQSVDVDGSGSPILVNQFSDLVESLLTLVAADMTGNVLKDNGAGIGGDGGHVQSITIDGITYNFDGTTVTWQGEGIQELEGTTLERDTDLGGHFVFYFAADGGHEAGDWIYTPPEGTETTGAEIFNYVLADNDGDTSQASIGIAVAPAEAVLWDNTQGGDWHTAANWSPDGVPALHANVAMVLPGTYTVTAHDFASVDALVVGSGVTFDVSRAQNSGMPISVEIADVAFNQGTIVAGNGATVVFQDDVISGGSLISRNGGTMQFAATLAGVVALEGGHALFSGAVGAEATVKFTAAQSMLALTDVSEFGGHIVGFRPGDAILLRDSATFQQVSYDVGDHGIEVTYTIANEGGGTIAIGTNATYDVADFALVLDNMSGTRLVFNQTWIGGDSNVDPADGANWSLGVTPSALVAATVDDRLAHEADLDGGVHSLAGLFIGEDTQVDFSNGNLSFLTLHNSGAVSIADGYLVTQVDAHNESGATIEAREGGWVNFLGSVEGSGTFLISGGTMGFYGAVDEDFAATFNSETSDRLNLSDFQTITLKDFGVGDSIGFSGFSGSVDNLYVQDYGAFDLLHVSLGGADKFMWLSGGDYSADNFVLGTTSGMSSISYVPTPSWFAPGDDGNIGFEMASNGQQYTVTWGDEGNSSEGTAFMHFYDDGFEGPMRIYRAGEEAPIAQYNVVVADPNAGLLAGGTAGKDVIIGVDKPGGNFFDSLAGNDAMFASVAQDTFVFRTGTGHDTVIGFDAGHDKLDIDGLGVGTSEQAWQAFIDSGVDNGGGLVFTHDGDSLFLQDVHAVMLSNFVHSAA